jgi:inosose dehydratase
MNIRIGTNPIAWSNDDLPALGGDTALETCLSQARQAGFVGIELGNKFPRNTATLRPILAAHDLALISGWYSGALCERGADAEMAALRPHLDLLKAMGCNVLIYAECTGTVHGSQNIPLSRRPMMAEADWAPFAARLTALAEMTAAENIALCVHHHMGTRIQTGPEIDRMMDMTGDAVKLLLDTGHATWAGADPAALARRHRARIGHVHCKDVRAAVMAEANAGDWSFLDAVIAGVYTVPGDGIVDLAAVLRELPDYDGWLVVEAEQDPARANPLRYAKLGHAAVMAALPGPARSLSENSLW